MRIHRLFNSFVCLLILSTTGMVGGPPISAQARLDPQSPTYLITGIHDLKAFFDRCPNEDPIYSQLKQDVELRLDGSLITTEIDCPGPVSLLPVEKLTNQLMAMQVYRTAYYMSYGMEGYLPWTEKSLYDWLTTNVAGLNFKTAPGQQYCCDYIDGKLFFSSSLNTYPYYRNFFDWDGVSSILAFYAHEIRHADPGAPGHVNGCPLFPLPSDPYGCDQTYDISNLGAYGIQYWLETKWATGEIEVGIGCLPENRAKAVVEQHASNAHFFSLRMVTNPPPDVSVEPPYGGPCMMNFMLLPMVEK